METDIYVVSGGYDHESYTILKAFKCLSDAEDLVILLNKHKEQEPVSARNLSNPDIEESEEEYDLRMLIYDTWVESCPIKDGSGYDYYVVETIPFCE